MDNQVGKKRNVLVPISIGISVVMMIVFCMVAVIFFKLVIKRNYKNVNLNDYATIEVTGFNHYAEAEMVFDKEGFIEKYEDKIQYSTIGKKELGKEITENYSAAEYLAMSVDGGFSSDRKNLSNGDILNFYWLINYSIQDKNDKGYFNYKIDYSNIYKTVDGLEEVSTFDPFDYLELDISGKNGKGLARALVKEDENNKQITDNLRFQVKPSNDLSNGDTVTITALFSSKDKYVVETYNALPSRDSMEYTVVELIDYMATAENQTDESLAVLHEKSEEMLKQQLVYDRVITAKITDITYLGNYFYANISGKNGAKKENSLFLIYKIQADISSEEKTEHVEYYTYAKFDDVYVDMQDKISMKPGLANTYYGLPYEKFWKNWDEMNQYSLPGFETIPEMEKAIIDTKNWNNKEYEIEEINMISGNTEEAISDDGN